MERDKEQLTESTLLSASQKIKASLDSVDALLKQKSQTALLVEDIATKLDAALSGIIKECESGSRSAEESLEKLLNATKGILASIRANAKSLNAEALQLKGYREGVSASSKMFDSILESAIRENKRVNELASLDEDTQKKRKPGQRPESLRVKRKANALRDARKAAALDPKEDKAGLENSSESE